MNSEVATEKEEVKFWCKKCGELEIVEELGDVFKMGKLCFACNREKLKAKDIKSITYNKKKNKVKKEKKRYENQKKIS